LPFYKIATAALRRARNDSFLCHCEPERKRSNLTIVFPRVIASPNGVRAKQSLEIATRPSVVRNDREKGHHCEPTKTMMRLLRRFAPRNDGHEESLRGHEVTVVLLHFVRNDRIASPRLAMTRSITELAKQSKIIKHIHYFLTALLILFYKKIRLRVFRPSVNMFQF
jgi:hypothetical protein